MAKKPDALDRAIAKTLIPKEAEKAVKGIAASLLKAMPPKLLANLKAEMEAERLETSEVVETKAKTPRKTPKAKRGRKPDIEHAKAMVAYADQYGTKPACDKYGVGPSAISKARKRLKESEAKKPTKRRG